MNTEHKSTETSPLVRAALTMTVVVMAVIGLSLAADAQPPGGPPGDPPGGDDPTIVVLWDEDGMGFNVTSTKGLSNVIVLLCDGTVHKHEDRFNGTEIKTWEHHESQDILAIWVKSGSNHDPENPAPGPFDNPGAGQMFENPFADCADLEPQCVGPSNVSATVTDNGTILVSWDGVNGEDGYNIYRHDGDGNFTLLGNVSAPTTAFEDDTALAGTTYTYTVTATAGDRESDQCSEDSTTIPREEPTCGPSNVSATGMVDGTILVSWDGVYGEDGYNIYREMGGGSFSFLAHVDAPTTEFSDNDTVVATTYTYRVTATTGDAESGFCEEASATAIPVFPGLAAAGMAVLASIGAYGFVRRRQ